MKKLIKAFLILLIYSYSAISQTNDNYYSAMGLGMIYNFQTESFGADARLKIPLTENISFVPRFSYYLPMSKINEYYIGADINYYLLSSNSLNAYILAAGYYNNWINNEQFIFGVDKKNNIVAECGTGIVFNFSCRVKYYIEYRYDIKWKEGSLGTGLLFSFQSCNVVSKCPAYKIFY